MEKPKVGETITRKELVDNGWSYVTYYGKYQVYKFGTVKLYWDEETKKVRGYL